MKKQWRGTTVMIVGVATALMMAPLAAFAALSWDDVSGMYIGGGYGQAQNKDINNTIGGGDDKDHAWKAFVGADSQVLGLEAGYTDLGTTSNAIGSVKAKGWTADILLSVPINPQFKLFAKGGGFRADVDSSVLGVSRSDTSWEPTYGAGVGFNFNRNFGLRGEWERFDMRHNDAINNIVGTDNKDRIDLISASVVLRFH